MSTPTILPLRCPGCGGRLHGLPEDVVFWCEDCHGLQELVGADFVPRQGAVAAPRLEAAGRLCHLPVWALRVAASWSCPDPVKAALLKGIAPPEWVYVTAFALHNAFYFGDPGLVFTQRRMRLERADPAPLLGCTRGLELAREFVEPHLLGILDRREDVTGLELDLSIGDAILWGIPYYDDGLTLTDGIVGLKIPAAALDELWTLRTWNEGRR